MRILARCAWCATTWKKKPLFYTTRGGGLRFASTLPALLELLPETPPVNTAAVMDFLNLLSVLSPHSMFEGVHKLPPGTRLQFQPR